MERLGRQATCRGTALPFPSSSLSYNSLYVQTGFRQVAGEDAGYQISLINRVLGLLVSGSLFVIPLWSGELTICRLYFPGVLVGPYLEYTTYSSLIEGTLFDATSGSSQPQPRRLIPNGRKRTAYRKMLFALGYLGLYMGVAPKISFHTALTDWFPEQSLPYRFVFPTRHTKFILT